jgi:hypothetical protein
MTSAAAVEARFHKQGMRSSDSPSITAGLKKELEKAGAPWDDSSNIAIPVNKSRIRPLVQGSVWYPDPWLLSVGVPVQSKFNEYRYVVKGSELIAMAREEEAYEDIVLRCSKLIEGWTW